MLQFANPALLFGTLLLAVPLIIHLLNRRRHKVRRWAAMEFLLRAYQKQRRRLRRENLLLLLLRCAIPVLLALAIARPALRDVPGLGSFGGPSHHVFVFDASYSMGLDVTGGTTPFERGKQLAAAMIERIARRSGQMVSIVTSGVRPTMPMREDLNLDRAKDRIAALQGPFDAASDLTPALLQVADLVEQSTDREIRVHLFTDLQARAFGPDPFALSSQTGAGAPADGSRQERGAREPAREPGTGPGGAPPSGPAAQMFADSARDAIARIQQHASLTVLDVRSSGTEGGAADNLQVTDVRLGQPHAIVKAPVPVHARLLNRTGSAQTVPATLEIDGEQPIRASAELEAGAEGEVTFPVVFRELGQRRVRVSIEGDDLVADNARHLVVPVRERIEVLVVEGSSEEEPELRDATHLVRILDPTHGGGATPELAPFSVHVADTVSFLGGRERLAGFDVIVLANVPRLNETAGEALRTALDAGVGLFVMLGDHADLPSYDLHLGAAGRGPLPLQLLDVERAPSGDRALGAHVLLPDHPVFADFTEKTYFEIFQALPIHQFVRTELLPSPTGTEPGSVHPGPAHPGADAPVVLATVGDAAQSPLLVARSFGSGRALFLTSAISRRPDRWNGLDYEVVAFPLLHQITHWLATPAVDPFNVEVGASLTASTPKRPSDLAVVVAERAGGAKIPIGDEPVPLLGGRYALPPFSGTDMAGFYTVEMMLDHSGAPQRDELVFAVNPDVDEGDLRYFSHAAARERLGVRTIVSELPGEGEAAVAASFNDLAPLLLGLTLLAVLGEAALARWVSRRRT